MPYVVHRKSGPSVTMEPTSGQMFVYEGTLEFHAENDDEGVDAYFAAGEWTFVKYEEDEEGTP